MFLTRMALETDRLAQLVEELLELALLESGAAVRHEAIDAAEIVSRAVDRLRASADRRGVAVRLTGELTTAPVVGDALRLEQVLTNLLDNATKFTAPGGEVVLRFGVQADQVVISVSDNGAGIPADEVGRVFERFYKADRARSSSGTGLGLAIAKHTVEAHGGRIWVESAEGRGSTFFVALPSLPAKAEDGAGATPEPVARRP
jgi:two-component system phosphate regulon sensor histidine kinase PhoR